MRLKNSRLASIFVAAALAQALASAQTSPAGPPSQVAPAPSQAPLTQAQQLAKARAILNEAKHQADIKSDEEEGKKYAAEFNKTAKFCTDKAIIDRVQRIGKQLAVIEETHHLKALWGDKRFNPFPYSFTVLHGPDVNAFSLPGGYVYIYDSLVKFCQSDDELAGVLAHEMSHVAFRHVATLEKQASKISTIEIPVILMAILSHGSNASEAALLGTTYTGQALMSGWSVQAEEAADFGGLQILSYSKYNPTGMLTLMERLALVERNQPTINWGIFRTHPPSLQRAEALISEMNAMHLPIQRSKVTTSFRVTERPGNKGTVDLLFGKNVFASLAGGDALTRADALVPQLNSFFDQTPDLYEVQAGDAGDITFEGRSLLQLTDADAQAQGKDLAAYESDVLHRMRAALISLGFNIWEAK